MNSCLCSSTKSLLKKEVYIKMEQILYFYTLDPFSKGRQTILTVASPESVSRIFPSRLGGGGGGGGVGGRDAKTSL